MRPLYVVLVWIGILGGLWAYTSARDALHQPPTSAVAIQRAPGNYALQLTPTFDAAPVVDKFGLEPTVQPAIFVRLNGREIVNSQEPAPTGIPQRFTWDTSKSPVLADKENLLYLELAAPQGDASALRGVRVQMLRDDATIADEMLWSQPGAPVKGSVALVIPAKAASQQHEGHE